VSTRFTVTIRCDARLAPDCAGERTETRDTTDGFEGIAVRLLQEGWDWDLRPRRAGHTHDVCPACAEGTADDVGTTHE
jgi:hypothetical protein